jgi:hypothetical protein
MFLVLMVWNGFLGFLNIFYIYLLNCVFILLVGFIIGKIVGRIVEKVLKGMEINNFLKRLGSGFSFDRALAQIAEFIVYVITFIFLLQFLGIRNLVLVILLFIFVSLFFLSVFIAVLFFIPNFFVGFILKKKFKKGDFIYVIGIKGRIKKCRFSDVIVESKKDVFSLPYLFIKKNLSKIK